MQQMERSGMAYIACSARVTSNRWNLLPDAGSP